MDLERALARAEQENAAIAARVYSLLTPQIRMIDGDLLHIRDGRTLTRTAFIDRLGIATRDLHGHCPHSACRAGHADHENETCHIWSHEYAEQIALAGMCSATLWNLTPRIPMLNLTALRFYAAWYEAALTLSGELS